MEKALFAAGCFWGVEEVFSKISGVTKTAVGYTGGHTENPSYRDVCSGQTGHAEAIEIEFDPELVSYTELLDIFWQSHNPTTLNRQGPDVGTQYRSAIFYLNDEQKKIAEDTKEKLNQSNQYKGSIITEITPASTFYQAEDYHQQYFAKKRI